MKRDKQQGYTIMTKLIDGPSIAPKSGKTRFLVVLLHGYGASGDDLISIGHEWAPDLPDTAFVSPNAPDVCEMWAQGYQWFSIRALQTDPLERARQAAQAAPALHAFLDAQLEKWDVPESRMIVGGFSQGAMMAMYTMPRRKNACAGVIGYSGMLIDGGALTAEGMSKMPVLAIHGDSDEIVPPASLHGIEQGFGAAGYNVETVMRPGLGHGIDHFGLTRGLSFIQKNFDKAG